MIRIIFESHATTYDNEARIASGWFDVELSEKGLEQAAELGKRYDGRRLDVIFCSDLQRSYKTAQIAFGDRVEIIQDKRLRECDYGELTRNPMQEINKLKEKTLTTPYPNGESFEITSARVKEFIDDLRDKYEGKTIMIIGHRATQYGLDEHIKGMSLREAVLAPWEWQPGWEYKLTS